MSQAVHDMFSSIAHRYDAANDVLSFRIHRAWRRQALAFAQIGKESKLLDLCTGTGDMAFAVASQLAPSSVVIGVDFVRAMLSVGVKKGAGKKSRSSGVDFVEADALALPFEENQFDGVTIAFGIRNVDDVPGALREIRRVLRPQGQIVVLEFGRPESPLIAPLYHLYSFRVMPVIGQALTGNRAAYEYLPESSYDFPAAGAFLELLHNAGFHACRYKSLFPGVAYVYTARS